MKYLVEKADDQGRRLYLRSKNRYGSWTWWRWDARRFDTRDEAEGYVKPGAEFVVEAVENMDFSVSPPKAVTRVRPKLIERAERRWKERQA